jgi:type I restriction enzyme, S subunit
MNAERLLAHYEKIADAPDAIARLRRFVLDLAVRGKLVPQDAADEPASELLTRIAAEKARLVKAREIREPKASDPIRGDELPIKLPRNWAWARLCEIGNLSGGMTPSMNRSDFWDGNIVWLSPKDIKSDEVADSELKISAIGLAETRLELYRPGCLFMVARSGILKRTFPVSINRVPAAANQDMKVLVPFLDGQERYLQIMFRGLTDFILGDLVKTGTTVQSLKYAEFEQQPFPLPPLAEQRRIVAKVDELMALCHRLEAARAAREAMRDRLAAASLARLNAPDPETFRADARFALDALPALTARPDQIKQLRQTILNLAVRGKLVPQDANEEPASDLLKQIAAEKVRLFKAGKGKRQELLGEPDPSQAPFDLHAGWSWARFPELGTFGRGKSKHRPRNDPALFDGGTYLMIQTGDVARSKGLIDTYTNKYNDFGLSQSFKWPKGTLCITIAANIADSGILSFDACFPDSVVGFIPASMFENARYFEYFVRTAKANLLEFAPATAQKNINLEILTQVLIPLPPLSEQHRIVAKVDELMALCDRLEASLTAAADTRRRLLDALLAEALAPADARELEAAE